MYLTQQDVTPRKKPEILVVGGGKGGVGKTCFAANIAVEIARKGWRVVLVDADLGCSNLETVLGVQAETRLDDFFYQKGTKDLSLIVCDTQYDGLRLVPGTTGLLDVANPKYQQKAALIRELRKLDADLVIIDLEAGAHLNTLDFFLLSETKGVLVITPEKTSIDNAFKFLRSALFRKIERYYRSPEVALLLRRNETIRDFIDSILDTDMFEEKVKEEICGEIVAIARSVKPNIVVNRARNAYEAQIASNILAKYARQYLMIEPEKLGHVLFDKVVPDSVNSGVPFIVSHPRQKISMCISDIANRLGYL